MISTSSLILDGHHGHGLGPGPGPGPGGPHHPFLRSQLPVVPEFIRPLPKSIVSRYNAQRPSQSQSPRKEYQNVPVSTSSGAVNLTSVKHDSDTMSDSQISRTSGNIQLPHLTAAYPSRMFPPPGFHYPGLQGPYGGLYPSPYPSLLNRPTYINSTPLSPLERQYSPPQSTNGNPNSPAFLQPPAAYPNQNTPQAPQPPPPPPPPAKPGQSLLREKRSFKVPVGKDASAKQRVVTASKPPAKRVTLPASVNNNNNNLLPHNFRKGSLIQLGNGELKAVELVTTEDFVSSAERCPAFRLDPSTVVRIEENGNGTVLVTLSHGENKKTVEIESTFEHPYFVYGQGWASYSPERSMSCYELQCHRLQVGDICISLTPRLKQEDNSNQRSNSVKPAQISSNSALGKSSHCYRSKNQDSNPYSPEIKMEEKHDETSLKSMESYQGHSSDDEKNGKRRRWSAPDQLDAEDEFIDPGSPSPVQKRMKD